MIRDGNLFSKGNLSVEYQNPLNHHTIRSIQLSSIRSQSFTLDCLMSQKTDPLKSLLDVQRHTIKKSVPDAPKFYVLQGSKSACVLYSLPYALLFIGDKISADCSKN